MTEDRRARPMFHGHYSRRTKPVRIGVVRVWSRVRRLEYGRASEQPPIHGKIIFLSTLIWLLVLIL